MEKNETTKTLELKGLTLESEKEFDKESKLNFEYKNISKDINKDLKIKLYDLIYLLDVEISNSSKTKTRAKKISSEDLENYITEEENTYTVNIPIDLPYKKYKVTNVVEDENGYKTEKELDANYDSDKKILSFNTDELGNFAIYGKNKKAILIPIIGIIGAALIAFGYSYATIPEFRDRVDNIFNDVFDLDRPSAPVIEGGSDNWVQSALVKVKVPAEVGGTGKLDHYIYCDNNSEDYKTCEWKTLEGDSLNVGKEGIHYIWFKGVNTRGKAGKISNMQKVMIDTTAPQINHFSFDDVTDTSVTISIEATDNLSGIDKYVYQIGEKEGQGELFESTESTFTFKNLDPDKDYVITIQIYDKAGNYCKSVTIIKTRNQDVLDEGQTNADGENGQNTKEKEIIDYSLDEITYSVNPSNDVWATHKYVTIKYPKNATTKEYSVDGGKTWLKYTGPVFFGKNGTIIARCSNKENSLLGDKFKVVFIDPEIPIVSLDNVPTVFEYLENYKLPGYSKFGPSGGTVKCEVDGKRQANTSALKIGKHHIECTATSNAGASTTVTKDIEVTYITGQDEIWSGWANLTLEYPYGSYDREWKVMTDDTIVSYDDEYYQWHEYIGPIRIRVEDVEKVVIRYKMNGVEIIEAPAGTPLVDIEPASYRIEHDTTTTVKINYDNDAITKQYRTNGSGWIDYTGPFTVGPNTIIEARVVIETPVYDGEGNEIAKKKTTNNATAYIEEKNGWDDDNNNSNSGNKELSYWISFVNCPRTINANEIGTCTIEFSEDFDSTMYRINGDDADYTTYTDGNELEVTGGDVIYARGQKLINGEIKTMIRTFYVEALDGKVIITASDEQPDEGQTATITIKYDDLMTIREYKVDTGDNPGVWQDYTGPFEVEPGTTIDAHGKIPSEDDVYTSKKLGQNPYYLSMRSSNDAPYPGQTSTITIKYSSMMTTKKYRINGGAWQNYTGPFKVGPNTIIEAWGKAKGYYDVYDTISTSESIYVPSYRLQGPHIVFKDTADEYVSEVTLLTDKPARIIKYKIGYNGSWKTYDAPFEVSKGNLVYAYYIDEEDGIKSETTSNSVTPPYHSDYGQAPLVFIYGNPEKYSSTQTSKITVRIQSGGYDTIEYSYDKVMWQDYTGPFDIYENTRIYARATNRYGTGYAWRDFDYVTNDAPMNPSSLQQIRISATPGRGSLLPDDNSTTVTIVYDSSATTKYYRLGSGGSWQTYTGPFEVTGNTTIYAYQVTPNGTSNASYLIDWLEGGYADPIITSDPESSPSTLNEITIEYDQNAVKNYYSTDGKIFQEYEGTFDVEENGMIYAKSEFADGTITTATYLVDNILETKNMRVVVGEDYYIVYLNYPNTSAPNSRKYRYKKTGALTDYKESGIMLIKQDRVSQVLDADGNAYITVEDDQGRKIKQLYTGDHYLLDVDITEIWDHIFMTWENGEVDPPEITLDNTTTWADKVVATIIYPQEVISPEYRIIGNDGSDTGWLIYNGPVQITTNNVTLYARGKNKASVYSPETFVKIENIDNGDPSIRVMKVTDTTRDSITVTIAAEDEETVINKYYYSLDGINWIDSPYQTYTFENLAIDTAYTLYAKAEDEAGNMTQPYSIVVKTKTLDEPTYDVVPNAEDWSSEKEVTINYMDGNYNKEYSLDMGATWLPYTNPITLNSATTIISRISDDSGHVVQGSTLQLNRIDSTKPVVLSAATVPKSSRVTIQAQAQDNESGVLRYYYSVDGINYEESFEDTHTILNLTEDTLYTAYVKVENAAGLISDVYTTTFTTNKIDEPVYPIVEALDDKGERFLNKDANDNPIFSYADGTTSNTESATGIVTQVDNFWSYTKRVTINYPYVDEDCINQYAVVDLNNPQNLEWKKYVEPVLIDKENMAIISRVVSGPNTVLSSSTVNLGLIDRTEPTIDLDDIPKSIEIDMDYSLPSHFAGDPNKSDATAKCWVKDVEVTNTNELRSGMQPIKCTVTTGAGHSVTIEHTQPVYPSLTFQVDSILQGIRDNDLTDGDFYFEVNTGTETRKYQIELWNFDDTTLSDATEKFCDNIEGKMCVLKYNGNLTIDPGVVLAPQVNKKGFTVFVSGKLTNNGTISMSKLGEPGAGENVYLWKNTTNDYEMVPAVGGTGGIATVQTNTGQKDGNKGVQTSKRATGGGGAGGVVMNGNNTATSGAGGNGTSYSGGTGGGPAVGTCNVTGNPGSNDATTGGLGAKCGSMAYAIGGGAGNPTAASSPAVANAQNGAGGLLNIYATNLENNGTIESNGVNAPSVSSSGLTAGGGGTGGGSINLFYDTLSTRGTIEAKGGLGGVATSGSRKANGGAGADGRVTYNTVINDKVLGSETLPYIITTPEEFIAVKQINKDYDSAYFELGNDIDLNGYTVESIGTEDNPFSGHFDGKGYTVSNITITSTSDNQGVFGLVSNGIIKNMNIENADITGNDNVGIIAGSVYDASTITNISVSGAVHGRNNVGGAIGYSETTTGTQTIKEIIADTTIDCVDNIGGLIGNVYSVLNAKVSIKDSQSKTDITATGDYIGGLIGKLYTTSTNEVELDTVYAQGTAVGNDYVGGLIGNVTSESSDVVTINKAVASTDVEGHNYVGGLIGYSNYLALTNAYSVGNLKANDYAGAFIGSANRSEFENTYAIGEIDSTLVTHVGGYAGEAVDTTSENAYFSSQTTKFLKTALGINLRIQKMLYMSTCYNNYDFENIWAIDEGNTTAYIQGMPIPARVNERNIAYNKLYGEGSAEDPYLIYNATDLIEINNELDAYYKMMDDVDLTGIDFEPIGQEEFKFTGVLDGNNHKIKNLTIDKTKTKLKDNIGLFEIIEDATITDLTIEDANVSGDNNVGILVGRIDKSATINNIKVTGTIEATNAETMELLIIPSQITNSTNTATQISNITGANYNDLLKFITKASTVQPIKTVTAAQATQIKNKNLPGVYVINGRVGAIVGALDVIDGTYATLFSDFDVDVDITTDGQRIGGVVGDVVIYDTYDKDFQIQNVTSNLTINNTNTVSDYVGALAGLITNYSAKSLTINDITTSGDIYGRDYIGGTIGRLESESAGAVNVNDITNNANTTGRNNIGGAFGHLYNAKTATMTIDSVTSNADVSATGDDIGGVVGYQQNTTSGTINASSYASTGTITGKNYVGGSIGYLYAQNTGTNNVEDSYSESVIIATGEQVGGFVGRSAVSSSRRINNINRCYATGTVTGTTKVGGFGGSIIYTTVNDTFSTGAVNATNTTGSYAGELNQVILNNSYAIGRIITTGTTVGGFAATSTNTTATNNYFSSQTTGVIKTATGINNKIYKLLRQRTYNGYDFENVWSIDEDVSTAYLKGLPKPASVNQNNITYNKMTGEGTEEDPYIIRNADDLNDVRNEASAYYEVVADIDLANYSPNNNGLPMLPIGEAAAPFSGVIKGNGHTISNYTYSSTGDDVGLFSLATKAKIVDLNIENVNITGKNNVGGLIGRVTQGIELENVTVTGHVTGTASQVGGVIGSLNETVAFDNKIKNVDTSVTVSGVSNVATLVGYSNQTVAGATITIEDCDATTTTIGTDTFGGVTGTSRIGALVGYMYNTTTSSITIKNSTNTVDTTANEDVGGLVGRIESTAAADVTLDNLTNDGTVKNKSTSQFTGGIVARLRCLGLGKTEYTNLTNNGDVIGNQYTAGIFGYVYARGLDNTMETLENTGAIIGKDSTGGLIGLLEFSENSSSVGKIDLTDLTNTGTITATTKVGGLIGETINRVNGTITYDNFSSTGDVSGTTTVGGAIGSAYNTGSGKLDVKNGYTTGNVTSTGNYIGGLIANIYSGTSSRANINVEKTYATGDITTNTGNYAGGLIGSIVNNTNNRATVSKSYATGNMKAVGRTGGLIGNAQYVDITDTYATGDYENSTLANNKPTTADYVGGLVGSGTQISINTSYAMGFIKANGNMLTGLANYDKYYTTNNVGGLIGYSDNAVTIDSYYSGEASGMIRGVNGTNRTIKEMLRESNFNFDFTNVWTIEEHLSTPYLQELPKPYDVVATNFVVPRTLQGEGTDANPYKIYDVEDLSYMRYNLYASYELMNDIDLTIDQTGTHFIAIGEERQPFSGKLNGNGYMIHSGIVDTIDSSVGIFGSLKDAEITNLTIKDVEYVNNKTNTGGLAGIAYENVKVTGVNIENTNTIKGTNAGGIFGYISQVEIGTTEVKNVTVDAPLNGDNVGGIVGNVYDYGLNTIELSNIDIKNTITGNINVGGLIGYNRSDADNEMIISDIDIIGTVTQSLTAQTSKDHNLGGIIGKNEFNSNMTLDIDDIRIPGIVKPTDITTTANVTTVSNVGGLIGRHETIANGSDTTIENAKITGTVESITTVNNQVNATTFRTVTLTSNLGGIIGNVYLNNPSDADKTDNSSLEITSSYVTTDINNFTNSTQISNVSVSGTTGGFAGTVASNTKGKFDVNSSYVTGDVSGKDYVGGLIGKNAQNEIGTNKIELVYTTGEVTGKNYVGGLVGQNNGIVFATTEINKCYTTGEVTGDTYVGGFVGSTSDMTFNNDYSTSYVNGDTNTGAFIGNITNTSINNSYAVGKVTENSTYGGFVAKGTDSIATNSYFSSDTTTLFRTAVGTNMRIHRMIEVDPCYEEWNFTDIWTIEEGTTLAYLKELPKPASVNASNYIQNPYQGSGTEEAPFEIYTPDDLNNVRVELDKHYILMNDLDMTGYLFYPIGEDNQIFKGSFNGQGYKISNLEIANTKAEYNGLFGVVEDATIKNLELENLTITSTSEKDTGSLIGLDKGNTTIQNITIDSTVTSHGENTGGLIGRIDDNNINETVIENIDITSTINSTGNVGGVVGNITNLASEEINMSDITLNNNITGIVSGDLNIGGVVGYLNNVSDVSETIISNNIVVNGTIGIDPTYSTSVSADTKRNVNMGGVVGFVLNEYGTTNISNIVVTATLDHQYTATNSGSKVLTTYNNTGGIIGNNVLTQTGTTTIDNIAVSSDITVKPEINGSKVTRNTYTGGLIGLSENEGEGTITLSNSYSTGDIYGIGYVGGALGYVFDKSTGTTDINTIYTSSDITAESDYVGGFVGYFNGDYNGNNIIDKVYASGTITTDGKFAGSFAGQINYSVVTNSYTTSDITADNYASAFVSQSAYTVYQNIYTIGKITSRGSVIGSMVAYSNHDDFRNAYFSSEATGYTATKAGLNVRFEKLLEESTYNGYDFEDIWAIDEGDSTAYLQGLPDPTVNENRFTYAKLQGSGTIDDPYLIHDVIELQSMAGEMDAYYELANDIHIPAGTKFMPIGSQDNPFTGSLDGKGYTIYDLTIDYSLEDAGLLGYMTNAIVMRVNFDNADIKSTADYAGVVAGRVAGNSTVENITVSNSKVNSNSDYVGGIVGATLTQDYQRLNISNLDYTGDIKGKNYVGGLIGHMSNTLSGQVRLHDMSFGGTVSGANYIAGAVGAINSTGVGTFTFEDVYTSGTVTASEDYAGGLIAQAKGNLSELVLIQRTYADTDTSSINYAGGLIADADYINLFDAASTGRFGSSNYTGGLIGQVKNSNIDATYSYSNPTSYYKNYGGLIGISTNSNIEHSYYSSDIAFEVSSYGTDLDVGSIKSEASYEGFDFDNIWNINEGSTTPYLKGYSYTNNQSINANNNTTVTADSILEAIEQANHGSAVYRFLVNDKIYMVHLYEYTENQVWDSDMVFGTAADVGASGKYAQRMVAVKVDGDLTVNSGVMVRPYYTSYGGPKGFTLYVTGKLTNNGTIDNSHGGYAKGEDVYLWKNADDTYEVVPAAGTGGAGSHCGGSNDSSAPGISAGAASGRKTAGGGSGSVGGGGCGGTGGAGSSYSGGSGGGYNRDSNKNGSSEGGPGGGNGNSAGNPTNGTGGLLVIYSNEYENNGKLTANGQKSPTGGRGSSGGGSINIFTNQPTGIKTANTAVDVVYANLLGSASMAGGASNGNGGAGGAGTLNIGEIREGQYYDLKTIISQDINKYKEENTITGDSIEDILRNNNLETKHYLFKVEDHEYPVHVYNYNGDTTFTENMVFGESDDISVNIPATTNVTASRAYATNMVIVKVNGDLTIDNDVKVEPYYSTYGGPKGFTLYVTGKLTNNGIIDNSHGAYAQGEDVQLFKNADGTYETVPAVGGTGAWASSGCCGDSSASGHDATQPTGRATAGGGSGSLGGGGTAGVGGNGTSYSGGAGGGYNRDSNKNGSSEGGPGGGNGAAGGNPANGTGGLLVIYSNELDNNGLLSANGGRSTTTGRGSSGGGSINVFIKQSIDINNAQTATNSLYSDILGSTSVAPGSRYGNGGIGANGTVNIGRILDGQYQDLRTAIDYDKENYIRFYETRVFPKISTSGFTGAQSIIELRKIEGIDSLEYSKNNGTTWNEYTEPFVASEEDVVMAKGLYSNMETEPLTYEFNKYTTSLKPAAFDIDSDTADEIAADSYRRFDVSSNVYSRTLRFYFKGTISDEATVKVYGSDDVEIKSTKLNRITSVVIPNKAAYVIIYSGDANLSVSEVNIREYSILTTNTESPEITTNQVGWAPNKIASVTYPDEEGYVKEYSIDGGETWNEYTEELTFDENVVLLTRVMQNGNFVSSSSFNFTRIDNTDPTVELDIEDEYDYGDKQVIPTAYSYNQELSGGTVTCESNGRRYTNINQMPSGIHELTCRVVTGAGKVATVTKEITIQENTDITLGIVQQLGVRYINEGYQTIRVEKDGEITEYPVHMYIYNGDQHWTSNMTFGDDSDVATADSYAQRMVIVKVNGDLTIDEGVTVGPYYTQYGGPKGFLLYVTGELKNNGTIDNSHGAKAEGEDVYLWKNTDGTYEYIPAAGGNGGVNISGQLNGITGTGRQTGGGGTRNPGGNCYDSDVPSYGGTGTSYSGGTGGSMKTSGAVNGGAGGNGTFNGGAGNPGGSPNGKNGTGGLLVIYSDKYKNDGLIKATGTDGSGSSGACPKGSGASGGGSINIFTNQSANVDRLGIDINTRYNELVGNYNISGGTGGYSNGQAGNGGTGTINFGKIRGGRYYDFKDIISQDIESFRNRVAITGDSILSVIHDNNFSTGYYDIRANGEDYTIHMYNYDGDTTFSENMIFGDENDISVDVAGTSTTDAYRTFAKNMVGVKVNGDLTINENVTISPYSTSYGGPKGFLLYVTGKLINNGTIDNSHGAYAEGQNVYLWKNADGSYEYVPANGGTGGVNISGQTDGTAGTGRQTGGGGTRNPGGNCYDSDVPSYGGTGTSYSGGTGGSMKTSGAANGGAGGNGTFAGGAGNPGGSPNGKNGTGGLLIIYANEYQNNGTIKAIGTDGSGASGACPKGSGASGGGSINIFVGQSTVADQVEIVTDTRYAEILGNNNVTGGTGGYANGRAGAGGKGTINIGQIRDGQYNDLKSCIDQDKAALLLHNNNEEPEEPEPNIDPEPDPNNNNGGTP